MGNRESTSAGRLAAGSRANGLRLLALSLLMAATLLFAGFGVPALADEAAAADGATEATPVAWTHSKSKTATNLDADYESEVTLSLPSAEEQLTTEICFVLDGSSFSDTSKPALQLLKSLKDAIDQSGAKVQVDVIGFKRAAYNDGSYDLATQYDQIKAAFGNEHSGGTNMHAGLLLAQEVLKKDTSIPNSRKYMILVSDGDTYLWCKNNDYNTPYSRSFIPAESAGKNAYGGFYDDSWYNPSNPYGTNVARPSTTDVDAWSEYLRDVADRNQESNGDSYDYIWYYYDHNWASLTPDQVVADGFKTMAGLGYNTTTKYRAANNRDMAYYYAAGAYQTLAQKYHCYSFQSPSYNTADGGKSAFMGYLNNVSGGGNVSFSDIQNEILYFLGAGSTVEDYLGYVEGDYNFDLVDPAGMVVTVDSADSSASETYQAVGLGDNHYGFKPIADNDGGPSYAYEVVYTPADDGTEHLVWKMNVPVSNFEHVSLTYQVQLVNPQTEAGTYGEFDADGSQGKNGLFTNSKATLYPVASDRTEGNPEEFAKPTVSYTVEEEPAAPEKPVNPSSSSSATDDEPDDPGTIDDDDDGSDDDEGADVDDDDEGADADDDDDSDSDSGAAVAKAQTPTTGDGMGIAAGIAAALAALCAAIILHARRRLAESDAHASAGRHVLR